MLKNHKDIGKGVIHDIRRGIHPAQQWAAQGAYHRRHHQRKRHGEHDGIDHEPLEAGIVALTEFLRYRNGKAVAHADAEPQHQKAERPRGANACQRRYAQKLAHHDGVHHVVHLLKQKAKQQRKEKFHNAPRWRTLCHVPDKCSGHAGTLLYQIVVVQAHSIRRSIMICKGFFHVHAHFFKFVAQALHRSMLLVKIRNVLFHMSHL